MEMSKKAKDIKIGKYRHFKGELCKVFGVAETQRIHGRTGRLSKTL